jgi:hypothetical protein
MYSQFFFSREFLGIYPSDLKNVQRMRKRPSGRDGQLEGLRRPTNEPSNNERHAISHVLVFAASDGVFSDNLVEHVSNEVELSMLAARCFYSFQIATEITIPKEVAGRDYILDTIETIFVKHKPIGLCAGSPSSDQKTTFTKRLVAFAIKGIVFSFLISSSGSSKETRGLGFPFRTSSSSSRSAFE